jgi:hypothetical protein
MGEGARCSAGCGPGSFALDTPRGTTATTSRAPAQRAAAARRRYASGPDRTRPSSLHAADGGSGVSNRCESNAARSSTDTTKSSTDTYGAGGARATPWPMPGETTLGIPVERAALAGHTQPLVLDRPTRVKLAPLASELSQAFTLDRAGDDGRAGLAVPRRARDRGRIRHATQQRTRVRHLHHATGHACRHPPEKRRKWVSRPTGPPAYLGGASLGERLREARSLYPYSHELRW